VGQANDGAIDGHLKLVLLVEVGPKFDAADDARFHATKAKVQRVHETAAGRRQVAGRRVDLLDGQLEKD
jgi:hypothetical protein